MKKKKGHLDGACCFCQLLLQQTWTVCSQYVNILLLFWEVGFQFFLHRSDNLIRSKTYGTLTDKSVYFLVAQRGHSVRASIFPLNTKEYFYKNNLLFFIMLCSLNLFSRLPVKCPGFGITFQSIVFERCCGWFVVGVWGFLFVWFFSSPLAACCFLGAVFIGTAISAFLLSLSKLLFLYYGSMNRWGQKFSDLGMTYLA